MIDPLRALVAFTESVMITFRNYYAQAISREAVEQKMAEWLKLKVELDTLLSAPVVSLPETVSIVRCEHGGVQIEGHTALGDWELELDACGDIIEIDKGSAPVGSPPQEDKS